MKNRARTPLSTSAIYYVGLPVLLLLANPGALSGAPVSIAITAKVRFVEDWDNILGGAVHSGDAVAGVYTYDSSTPNSGVVPFVGDYRQTTAPYGVTLNVDGLTFRTDPNNVNFLLEVVNDHPGTTPPGEDDYGILSYNNIFQVSVPSFNPNDLVNYITWYLQDPTGLALSTTALPVTAPVLSDWTQPLGLDISSDNPYIPARFLIRSDVTAATLVQTSVPETASTLALALGACGALSLFSRLTRRSH